MKMTNFINEELLHSAMIKNHRNPKVWKKPSLHNLVTTNEAKFIKRSLAPAKISNIELDTINKKVTVYLLPGQVSVLGKNSSNIKLNSRLSGYEVDVYKDLQEIEIEDVDLEEFSDEIEPWVINQLKSIGCNTAKCVLETSVAELVRRTDLAKKTLEDVIRILQAEFDED